jgi:hypothetical protein
MPNNKSASGDKGAKPQNINKIKVDFHFVNIKIVGDLNKIEY